jgi:hypothetical protein
MNAGVLQGIRRERDSFLSIKVVVLCYSVESVNQLPSITHVDSKEQPGYFADKLYTHSFSALGDQTRQYLLVGRSPTPHCDKLHVKKPRRGSFIPHPIV